MLLEKAIDYAKDVIAKKEVTTWEVETQCKWFLRDLKNQKKKTYEYEMCEDVLIKVEGILKLMNFATGFTEGSVYDGLAPFQCFFIANIFGWRFKNDHTRFRYREADLFIARKNAKTFLAAIVIILLMLLEPKYSEFYSICLDRDLAAEIKKAIKQIIDVSPALKKHFFIPKITAGRIECLLTNSTFQARTSQANSNNSIRPAAFIADEFGAMKNTSNVNAMKSGQKSVKNPFLMRLTTAYAEDKSPMLEELDYLRKLYKGVDVNERIFALLYYADEKHLFDDVGMYQANPLRIERNYEEVRESRKNALLKPSELDEYLTKSMNHFVPSNAGEGFIDIQKLKKCKHERGVFNWFGRRVFVGLDLAMSGDNTSVSMLCWNEEDKKVYVKSWAFIPTDKIESKSTIERTNYKQHIANGDCFACGDEVVDYLYIEKFIRGLEKMYGVEIAQIGYDRYNCLATAKSLSDKYTVVEIRQHSDTLHRPTKWIKELVLSQNLAYEENSLLEQNFQNAKVVHDTNLNLYVHKKKSTGKVDIVFSILDAGYLLMQEVVDETSDKFFVQVI